MLGPFTDASSARLSLPAPPRRIVYYGTYEISPERAAFYRERQSPTLQRNPEATLDFMSESSHYVRRERRNIPEYMREVEQLALRQDGERTMADGFYGQDLTEELKTPCYPQRRR